MFHRKRIFQILICSLFFVQSSNFALAKTEDNSFKVRVSKNSFIEYSSLIELENANNFNDLDLDDLYFNLRFYKLLDNSILDLASGKDIEKNKSEKDLKNNVISQRENNPYKINFKTHHKLNINEKFILESKRLIAQNKFQKVEANLDIATLKDNSDAWFFAQLADLYELINKPGKAEFAYQKAILKNPERVELLYSYALCLLQNKNNEKATETFLQLLKINPNFMLAYFNLGNIYYAKGDYFSALKYFSKASRINPYNEDAAYNTALTLEKLKYQKLAIKYYQKCLMINPEDKQSQRALKRIGKN